MDISLSTALSAPPPPAHPESRDRGRIHVTIFSRLDSIDLLLGGASVCSSWRTASRDPRLWRILNLSDLGSFMERIYDRVDFRHVFCQVLKFVKERELIEKVYLPCKANGQDLLLVSRRLPNLIYISFPSSLVIQGVLCIAVSNFKSLKGIAVDDVSFTKLQMAPLLGTYCPDLSELEIYGEAANLVEFLVNAICISLPKLKKLEIQLCQISTDLTLKLLNSLEHLEYLNISGYDEPQIPKEILQKTFKVKTFVSPSCYSRHYKFKK